MLILVEVNGLLEEFCKEITALIVGSFLRSGEEIFKFSLVLFLIYYFALWSFQFLDEVLEGGYMPNFSITPVILTPEMLTQLRAAVEQNFDFDNKKGDLINPQITTDILVTNKPKIDNSSLIHKLEIEAEFEQNRDKFPNSEAQIKPEIYAINFNGNENISTEDISKIVEELHQTSRPTQTHKTSLGKKRKKTGISLEEDEELSPDIPESSKTMTKIKRDIPSYDDQWDHESFYRV